MHDDKVKGFPPSIEEEENPLEYCCPSASSGDMTGLIPYSASEEDALKSYNEMYPFLADDALVDKDNIHKKMC